MDSRFIFLAVLSLVWMISKLSRTGQRGKNLPPGPPTIPVVGNIHLLPLKFPFLRFSEWAREYGGIFSLKVANGTVIVVSDMVIVKELLDDRSSETSSRPSIYAADTITGTNYLVTATSSSHIWRMGRKAVQPLLAPQAVEEYLPRADAETAQLLNDILHEPEKFCSHVSRFTLSFMASVVFGSPVPRHDSPEATLFRDYIEHWSKTLSPAAAPVDLVPFLKYIPHRWAPWRRLWQETRRLQRSLYFSYMEQAEHKISTGLASKMYIKNILHRQDELGLSREAITYIGGVLLDGGAETSSSLIQSVILCLVKFPTCLQKAQEEIDSVVGNTRLPVLSDIKELPYVQAIIKERYQQTHRLRPVGPTGVPHTTINDCRYKEYIIPKGSPIFINIWGILHDPNIFERPEEFWPERYLLTPDGTRPGHSKNCPIRASLPFGSGKRRCPGMHLANSSSNLGIMRLLWAFNFAPKHDSVYEPTTCLEHDYNDGLTLTPMPFECNITPRKRELVEIIEDFYARKQSSE